MMASERPRGAVESEQPARVTRMLGNMTVTAAPTRQKMRLWPGIVIVALVWLTRVAAPLAGINAGTELMLRILGGLACALAVLIWWLGFSRASWSERAGAVAVLVAALAATLWLGDPSMLVWVLWYSAPVLSLALVAGAVASRRFSDRWRLGIIAAAIVLPCTAAL